MPTHASPFAKEPWSHDWAFDIISNFGDPHEGPDHGIIVSIKAASDEEAERRSIVYLVNNFGDEDRHRVTATSEGVLDSAADTYKVRLDFPWDGR